MDTVALDNVGDIDQIFVDHGDKGRVVLGGKVAKHLVECLNVFATVVGRQGDAGEQHLNVGLFKGSNDHIEIVASLVRWQTAETVVASKFDNGDDWMKLEYLPQVGNGILCGCSAGAIVQDFVVVTALIQVPLQRVGIRLAGSQPEAGRYAVAIANYEWSVGGDDR